MFKCFGNKNTKSPVPTPEDFKLLEKQKKMIQETKERQTLAKIINDKCIIKKLLKI